jgi:transposase
MDDDQKEQPGCPNCVKLTARIVELEQRLSKLEAELAKAKKHSGNSSKPPSSDIVNAGKDKKKRKKKNPGSRKRGGQVGHPRHERPPFAADQIDVTWLHYYDGCPCCGGKLIDTDAPVKVLQQVELKQLPLVISEHQRATQRCTQCQKEHCVPWPEDLRRAGLVGPRLTALIGYLKSACHMSYSSIRKFMRDVVGVKISNGQLRKLVAKVTDSIAEPYEELLELLISQDQLNVDETGHKDNGKRLWTWCFRASLFTVFKISPSRGSKVLVEVLGREFNGVLGCDYFSAYRKYMKDFDVVVQFCLAHLIRDIKFLVEHPQAANRAYGKLLREHFRKLFETFHRRDEYASEKTFQQALLRVRDRILHDALMACPDTREADNLNCRFIDHFESYFRFITTPGIEPTNNLAEQAIRFVAIHRRITQGTRSPAGQTWCERIWTIIATCEQQGHSLFHYLCDTVQQYLSGRPVRSLVPTTDSS